MEFRAACGVVCPLGKHKGRTIDEIAEDDDGLRYLDWLVGQDWIYGQFKDALKTYLANPVIAQDLNRVENADPDEDYT